jgi:hypothetical protein
VISVFASQIENETEGIMSWKQCLTSKGNHKLTCTVHLRHGNKDGIAVFVPKETILKEIAAKIE